MVSILFSYRRIAVVLFLFALSASPCFALELTLPLICEYGKDCFVQNYADTDPSDKREDYNCGQLTYDGHKGTDFRVPWADYLSGVEVIAAAPGVVSRIRDEMEDRDARGRKESVHGREAGNAVIIRHDDGYETMYAHLKRGSVQVLPGQRVKRGQVLGLVGLSGLTVFSHLHFGVTHKGDVICPFKGIDVSSPAICGDRSKTLWSKKDSTAMSYIETGLLQAGFFQTKPSLPNVIRVKSEIALRTDSPLLVFAVTAFGVQPGDKLKIRIIGPSGGIFAKGDKACTKHQAQRLLYTGRKLGKGRRWTEGEYRGEYSVTRNGKVVLRTTRRVWVK